MLEVFEITKQYEGKPLLRGVSFRLQAGETLCLLGPSGSGKSTLLRIIAGIETAEGGSVLWEGRDLAQVPVHLRGFGLMFQDYALFPHLNVAENVAFGLRMQGLPATQVRVLVAQALEQVNLGGFEARRVTDLSGGEQQRVALARALAPRPKLLMLDEPLGALDRNLREQLLEELRHLLHATDIPAIYVTHDQEEAYRLADRLLVLHEGIVVQAGQPAMVYDCPASAWVAAFLGQTNQIEGRVLRESPLEIETRAGRFTAQPGPGFNARTGEAVTLLFRSSGVQLAESLEKGHLSGIAEDVVFRGDGYLIDLRLDAGDLFSFHLSQGAEKGARLYLALQPGSLMAFSR